MNYQEYYECVSQYVGWHLNGVTLNKYCALMKEAQEWEKVGAFKESKAFVMDALEIAAPSYVTEQRIQQVLELVFELAPALSSGQKTVLFDSLAKALTALQAGEITEAAWHLLAAEANRFTFKHWKSYRGAQNRPSLVFCGDKYPMRGGLREPRQVLAHFIS